MVAVFVLDKNQRCRFINAVAEHLTGVPLTEAIGQPFADLIWKQTPATFDQTFLGRALGSNSAQEGEESLVDNDGNTRSIAFRLVPIDLDPAEGSVVEIFDLGGETGAARALRESERRLRLATEATGIGIWDVNAVTGRRQWSAEFKDILGLPHDTEASSDLFVSLVHPDDRGWLDDLYRHKYASPGDPNYTADFRIFRQSDGTERWVSTTGRITFDADGRPLRGVGTLRDIHERHRSEAAVRESEERLRVALVAGRMGLWRYDLSTGQQEWDATQYQILGLDPSAPASRQAFLSLLLPEDLPNVEIDLSRLPPPGTFLDSEFRIRRPDGTIRWLTAHALVRYDPAGRPAEMIGVNRDITDQKEAAQDLAHSEERLRLAIEANDVGTWDFDMVSGKHTWSAEFRRMWGLPEDGDDDPELLRPLVNPEDWGAAQTAWAEASDPNAGTGRVALEFEIHRADTGERRWCSFAGQVFFDAQRTRPVRAVGIALDITARKEIEDRQRRLLRELHHRVNNNLAVIQAILSQTARGKLAQNAFERIQARIMCLARVHDILNRSEWGEVAISRLLTSEIDLIEANSPRVTMTGDPVLLDSTAAVTLGLVIHELTTNAAIHGAMSLPEGRIEISWKMSEDPKRRIDITWNERFPRSGRPPRREGFGFRVIRSSVATSIDGKAEVDFTSEGVRWQLGFPVQPPHSELATGTVH